ncbi:hypothetical protein [Actinacidiphila oryziradicis]|uniref:Holin n=1 Tax=Actinacidiphila oryziradicis TaxID=2571141 RepID=A0A4U0RD03_9ACTN|nr:hypothetical protein [Actinacidiphila oryziradicis]TJZ93209.1 hypothetical protein FCI23_54570 [Actinacidiphila oryziradicis]
MTDSTRRMLRTTVQLGLGLLAALPALVDTGTVPSTLPGLGIALVVSSAVTKLMAIQAVDQLLPSWLQRTQPASPSAVEASTR